MANNSHPRFARSKKVLLQLLPPVKRIGKCVFCLLEEFSPAHTQFPVSPARTRISQNYLAFPAARGKLWLHSFGTAAQWNKSSEPFIEWNLCRLCATVCMCVFGGVNVIRMSSTLGQPLSPRMLRVRVGSVQNSCEHFGTDECGHHNFGRMGNRLKIKIPVRAVCQMLPVRWSGSCAPQLAIRSFCQSVMTAFDMLRGRTRRTN